MIPNFLKSPASKFPFLHFRRLPTSGLPYDALDGGGAQFACDHCLMGSAIPHMPLRIIPVENKVHGRDRHEQRGHRHQSRQTLLRHNQGKPDVFYVHTIFIKMSIQCQDTVHAMSI